MEGLGENPQHGEPPLSHGFKVGVGTVSIAALYERVLERDLARLDTHTLVRAWAPWEEVEQRVRSALAGTGLEQAAVEETRAKYIDANTLARRLGLLTEGWSDLRDRLRRQLMPTEQVRAQLSKAGCPTTPIEIGLSIERCRATYRRAQMIRRRYTILDLANEAGILDACVDELFAGDGFWGAELQSRQGA